MMSDCLLMDPSFRRINSGQRKLVKSQICAPFLTEIPTIRGK